MLKVNKRSFGDVTILCLQGQLVTGETQSLCDVLRSEVAGVDLVADMARVNRIDAGGLGTLLELREHALSRGINFRLINVSRLIREVFVISCLDSVFGILSERDVRPAALVDRPGKIFQSVCA